MAEWRISLAALMEWWLRTMNRGIVMLFQAKSQKQSEALWSINKEILT
jgi:hypothetical protein